MFHVEYRNGFNPFEIWLDVISDIVERQENIDWDFTCVEMDL